MQRPVKVSAYPKTEETRSPEHIHTLRHSPLRRRCECVTNFSGINVLLLPTTTYLKTMDLFQVCGYLRLLVYIITTLSTSSLCIVLDVLSTVHGREHVPSRHTCSMYLRSNALMHSKVYEQSPREASHKSRQHGHALLRRTSPVKHTDTFPEEPGTWLDKQRHSSCAVPAGQTDLAVAADRSDACPNANRIQSQTASMSTSNESQHQTLRSHRRVPLTMPIPRLSVQHARGCSKTRCAAPTPVERRQRIQMKSRRKRRRRAHRRASVVVLQ